MPAIKIEGLSKRYLIGHQKKERYTALRDVLMHKLRGIGERLRHPLSPNREVTDIEEFWALKDIDLEIEQGDRVGIIGRNGAGKSTLLKVLSRITEPTTGRITIQGRIASLLEVGTGFHPELSGRENIYLNGAILGMTRAEIKRKFDEIVDFSGVEKFLDTPVKRYSSGMYVRLAFAVAAHLEPEILVVDEVLAVGDAEFQKKCLGKMEDVGKEGRTVLFVSHNLAAIKQLTNKAIHLTAGRLVSMGATDEVAASYVASSATKEESGGELTTEDRSLIIRNLRALVEGEREADTPLRFEMVVVTSGGLKNVSFGIGIYNSLHSRLSTSRFIIEELKSGANTVEFEIRDHHFPPGDYSMSLGISISSRGVLFKENVLSFEIGIPRNVDPLMVPYLSIHRDQIGAFLPVGCQIRAQ